MSSHPVSVRRGIGEAVGPHRKGAELAECQVHESLLQVAFSEAAPFWLLCPYDAASLDESVLDQARQSHEFVVSSAAPATNRRGTAAAVKEALTKGLPDVPEYAESFAIDLTSLAVARRIVRARAVAFGLGESDRGGFRSRRP